MRHLKEPVLTLLIEDDDESADVLTDILETAPMAKYIVRRRHCVKEAREFLATEAPDLVLLDLRLPNGIGLAVVKEVKTAAKETPVVVYTGLDDDTLAVESISELADDYLVKANHTAKEIQSRIMNAVVRRRARDDYSSLHSACENQEKQLAKAERDPNLPPYPPKEQK